MLFDNMLMRADQNSDSVSSYEDFVLSHLISCQADLISSHLMSSQSHLILSHVKLISSHSDLIKISSYSSSISEQNRIRTKYSDSNSQSNEYIMIICVDNYFDSIVC